MTKNRPKRGDVYWVYLDPVVGSEQNGRRPVVIVSPDDLNQKLQTKTIIPLTKQSKGYKMHIPIEISGQVSYALVEQVRVIDEVRIKRKKGEINNGELKILLATLREYFAE